MKQALLTLFLLLLISALSHSQPVGQWGICEFASKAAMDAYDPSDSQWNCKKAFVNATGDHYQWDGVSWEKEEESSSCDCRILKINTSAQTFSGSTKNNWTPPNYTSSPFYEVYRINVTDDTDITGINASGVSDGQKISLINIGTKKMKFKHDNSSSSSANRFMLVDYSDETINKGESITFIYDATSAKWWVYAINQ